MEIEIIKIYFLTCGFILKFALSQSMKYPSFESAVLTLNMTFYTRNEALYAINECILLLKNKTKSLKRVITITTDHF